MGLDSPFYAGSVAKQFTGACIATLVLDGLLAVTTPVRRVLPQLPPAMDAVQIQHLVAHTSGLPGSAFLDAKAGFGPDSRIGNAERLAALSDVELEAPPGEVHRYNNVGYVLLAEVVAATAGETFGSYAARELLEPAGMRTSGFVDSEHPEPVPGWSVGARVEIQFTTVGDGGLITSVRDLLRWNRWLTGSPMAGVLLGPRPAMPDGTLAHDAWGISIRSHRGLRIESHGGAFAGYLCSAVRFPHADAVFVAMTNKRRGGDGGVRRAPAPRRRLRARRRPRAGPAALDGDARAPSAEPFPLINQPVDKANRSA